ncbi:hypothetical protein PORY_000881 [Pneumocystis oryctolagi]|uniref:Uncharacterized protein n=1 Tax=Pneumocystis oryctolagi TaxID=42067 RepID=A0ACB7CDV8_9ASCO|nr:hypothetical protein PORY_000881 [Pneumocystis oryctolagi]
MVVKVPNEKSKSTGNEVSDDAENIQEDIPNMFGTSLHDMLSNSLYKSEIKELKQVIHGKVRDVYTLGEKQLLFVATDRVSAYDVVLRSCIPEKGRILTALSSFWFKKLRNICKHHLIDTTLPSNLRQYARELTGRIMVVSQCRVLPIEAIVRGYIAGSAWKEYVQNGTVNGIVLRPNLKQGQMLDTPLFTPSTKAVPGQRGTLINENLHPTQLPNIIGEKHAKEIERLSLMLYNEAHTYALQKGIIIADTKFEFGVDENDDLILVDEVLTPDSSRFWPCHDFTNKSYSLDKQYIRDWLETHDQMGKAGVVLPEQVIQQTRQKYIQVYEQLTGNSWTEYMKEIVQKFVDNTEPTS